MTDLFDTQYKMLKRLEGDEETLDSEELIALAIQGISKASYEAMNALYKQKTLKRKSQAIDKVLIEKIHEIVEWTTILHYGLGIDTPEFEDVTNFADLFEDEIAADGVLCVLSIQRGLSSLGISYFTEEDTPVEVTDQDVGEILAGCELLARRMNLSVQYIINGQVPS